MSFYEDNRPGPESPIDEMDTETLVELAASITYVLSHSELDECPEDALRNTGTLITAILETVSWRSKREFYERQDKRDAEQNEQERLREDVETYFDPETDEAKRAQLEESVSEKDIAAVLRQQISPI
jgi:hypothetical protein